jgi:iron complex outermembrane receptor protein
MKSLITLLLVFAALPILAQTASIKGQLQDPEGEAVMFANVLLYAEDGTTLVKAETSNESGVFQIQGVDAGTYQLKSTYVGLSDFESTVTLEGGQALDLGVITFATAAVDLTEAVVTADRAMVEVKADRTIFNVSGTINSVGSDAIELLRKSPGVMVDNNDNINVLGRSGVLLYVDGKRMPLSGEELVNFLRNLPAEQIDRIEIITNPGARYEAEGNAGIIDIRMKRDENLGANGSVTGSFDQGRFARTNGSFTGNYRNKFMNTFVTGGGGLGQGYFTMDFLNFQNGLVMDETNYNTNFYDYYNARIGTDFYIGENQIIGFLVDVGHSSGGGDGDNEIFISRQETPDQIDSILQATSESTRTNRRASYNLNYRFDNKQGRVLNIDADYGTFINDADRFLNNTYYGPEGEEVLTRILNRFETPTNIDIYSFTADYEDRLFGGTIGVGAKYTQVVSDNTFLVNDVVNDAYVQNNFQSNEFEYNEAVYAAYLNYARQLGEKWNFSAGLRAEQTDATGNLMAFLPELMEPPVEQNYLSFFPSAGLTWQAGPKSTWALNYGRRINRPDYNVLNPFNNQLSQLSYEKGNPFLRPEIVNNIELGYTLAYRYNFKLSYSYTTDQITRLIGPDENDPRAGFITWENLAEQTIVAFNVSAPVQITKWWNAYINANGNWTNNQADYGDGGIVDVQAWSYSFYQQHTFDIFWGMKAEVSGWFSGPGVWGGVFLYDPQGALNVGLQKRFLNNALNVRLSANDILYSSNWSGVSDFNGLRGEGAGFWDSRRVGINVSYNFGNQNVKSRKRNTGLDDAADRVGGGDQ